MRDHEQTQELELRVVIFGGRGSTPAPGEPFSRYGGHTSCVALAHDGEQPTLILDAGTGIRRAGSVIGGGPFEGSILFGHLHWDHTQGIPFFTQGDQPSARVDVYVPAQGDALGLLRRVMSPPHFPITPEELQGKWDFQSLEPGEHTIEGFSVQALDVPHKGGRTFGYRITDGRSAVAYISDHAPTVLGPGPDGLGELHPAAMRLASDVDLLIHDAQYTDDELPAKVDYGHSAVGYAARLAVAARARHLLLFHHDPSRTDDEIDAMVASCRDAAGSLCVDAAAEMREFTLPAD
jgi:phosphoribosyl 1,2-cyclic phosphodiesterase